MINSNHDDNKSTSVVRFLFERNKENKNPNNNRNKEKKNERHPECISLLSDRHFGKELINNSLRTFQNQNDKRKKFVFNIQKQKNVGVIYLEKCEAKEKDNPQYVIDYSSDIHSHLKETERINKADYFKLFSMQNKVKEKERRVLIDWLVTVHFKFDLLPETLFLTISLLDRVIEIIPIDIDEFQLVGIAAMLIASKYEEIYAPEIRDFVYITGKSVSRQEILKMEYKVLQLIQFDILSISPYAFLQRYYFVSNDKKEETLHLTQLLLEVNLMNVSMMKNSPSLQAASMLYLARKMQKYTQAWNVTLQIQTGYVENDLKPCIKEFILFFRNVFRNSRLDSIVVSFSNDKYLNVGRKFIH